MQKMADEEPRAHKKAIMNSFKNPRVLNRVVILRRKEAHKDDQKSVQKNE